MVDKASVDMLNKMIATVEFTIRELEVKETVNYLKKTKDIEYAYSKTASAIKRAKEVLNGAVDLQIFGKDN